MSTIISDSGYDPTEVLNGNFDPAVHAKVFVNYLEVIIDDTGRVLYATPSHLKRLESIYCDLYDTDEQNLNTRMPINANPVLWLCDQTGCVCVWNDRYEGSLNVAQADTLLDLYERGLYTGSVPIVGEIEYTAVDPDLGDSYEHVLDHVCVDMTPVLDTWPTDELQDMLDNMDTNPLLADLDAHHLLPRPYKTWPGPVSLYLGHAFETYVGARIDSEDTDESLRDAGIRLYDLEMNILHDRKRDLEREIHAVNIARHQLVDVH